MLCLGKTQRLPNSLTDPTLQWTADNCDMLWGLLSEVDQKIFNFDVMSIVWEQYYPNFFRGEIQT